MHFSPHLIYGAIVALIWIGSLLLQFVRWLSRGLRGLTGSAQPNPMTPDVAARPAADVPQTSVPARPTAMADRPSAMPPRITVDPAQVDASSAAFRAQETRSAPPSRPTAKPLPEKAAKSSPEAELGLFGSENDFLRAIILQQVLGPPLSRRNRPHRP